MGLLCLLLLLSMLRGGSLKDFPRYPLNMQRSVVLQEGLCKVMSCFLRIPPVFKDTTDPRHVGRDTYFHWFRVGDAKLSNMPVATSDPIRSVSPETWGRFSLRRGSEFDCSLSIASARKTDTGTYYLQVEQENVTHVYKDQMLSLRVTALTEKPDIHFGGSLRSGHPETLTCSLKTNCKGDSPLAFFWAGNALAPLAPRSLRLSVLTLTPRPRDHGTNLSCRVTLPRANVSTERTVQLNVAYAPQLMTTSLFQGNATAPKTLYNGMLLPVPEGQSLYLVCKADSNPPARLSWFREERALRPSQPSAPEVLELLDVQAKDEGVFTCWAQHPMGSQTMSFRLSVQEGLQPKLQDGAGGTELYPSPSPRSPSVCHCETEEQRGSWPLVLTLIRGALMGAGFILTYGLTWIYYTRCTGARAAGSQGPAEPQSQD